MPIRQYLDSPVNNLFLPPHVGGRLYGSPIDAGVLTTVAASANVLYARWFPVPYTTTYTTIGVEITTCTPGGNIQLAIYNDATGVASSLALAAGSVSVLTGYRSISINSGSGISLSPGHYWLAAVFSSSPTCRAPTVSAGLRWMGFVTGLDTTNHGAASVGFSYAAPPDPFTSGACLMTGNPPLLTMGP